MLVIFAGSIGGFITLGVIGLFTGAVVLALGYKLLMAWLEGTVDRNLGRTSATH
jgi:predicted PurR-regulated permease PerM